MLALHAAVSLLLVAHSVLYLWLAVARARLGPLADPPASASTAPGPVPMVTVQVAVRDEGALVSELLQAIAQLDWPRHRLEVQLLDDSAPSARGENAATVARLAAAGVQVHHVARSEPVGFKAGAMANGMRTAQGEVIIPLDADFSPAPDLLRRLLPHLADPRVACVQVRWGHRNEAANLLTRAQAIAMEGHFVVEQRVRAAHGTLMSFNSTACAWRRQAIDACGGWSDATLAEDLDLATRAHLAGWRFVYLEATEVPALLAESRRSFAAQQARWARGSIQNARLHTGAVWRAPMSASRRLGTLHHLWHYTIHPLILAAVLLQAALVMAAELPAWYAWAWLAAGAVGPTTMYVVATLRLHGPVGLARLWRLAPLAAVGLGLTPRLAWATLRGLWREPGEFQRTVKGRRALRADPLALACAFGVAMWAVAAWPWVADPMAPGVVAFGLACFMTALWR